MAKLFTFFLFLILFQGSVYSQGVPKFQFSEKKIEMTPGGKVKVKVDVFLPKDNHLYLKRLNSLSFNIPTEFTISSKKGWSSEIIQFPTEGVEKGDDLILKGMGSSRKAGTYEIEIYETLGKSGKNRLPIHIKTQVCNSKTNICYHPRTVKKNLSVVVSGKKRIYFGSRSSSGISWETSYNSAFQKAKSAGKNVFVIITAPSWCGYCIRLENDVFSKSQVHSVLNQKFIPLRVLDSNPDKRKFNFSGYPTMYVMDSSKKILSKSIGRNESSFLSSIAPFEASGGGEKEDESLKSDYAFTIKIQGKFTQKDKQWVQTVDGSRKIIFQEVRRDRNYAILKNESNGEFIAFPLNGKQGFIYKGSKWVPYINLD